VRAIVGHGESFADLEHVRIVPVAGAGCIYPSQDFTGCDPTDASSCEGACADLDARIVADEARSFDVQRRMTRCEASSCLWPWCFSHWRSVFASRSPDATAYECSLDRVAEPARGD
jgi:hypothetical protein